VEDRPTHPVDLLASLARDYQKKYIELEEAIRQVPVERLPLQLKALAESATDRFRSAQMMLARQMAHDAALQDEETLQMLSVVFRCFDEMRIVFQILLERFPENDLQS
jgi:hypothetical protein